MKVQLGKQTGIALALLATLLATLLAMGVYSVAQASSHNAERSFSADTVEPGDNVVVTIALQDYTGLGSVIETLPEGFSYVSSNAGIIQELPNNQVRFAFTAGLNSFTYTVQASDAEGSYDFSGSFTYGQPSTTVVVGGDTTVTVEEDVEPAAPEKNTATSSTVPGSNQRLELEANIKVDERDAITVKFAKFGVPGTVDPNDVEIYDGDETGNPSSVSVSGTTVPLYFTDLNDASGRGGDALSADNVTTITFLKRAGITLPTSSGTFAIEISSTDTAASDQPVKNEVTTERTVTVDPDKGKRGTEVTITGKGFAGSRARVMITDSSDVTRTINNNVSVSGGSFELTVNTEDKDSEGDKYFSSGDSTINATDNDDMSDATAATYSMTPSFTFSPDSPVQSDTLTITLRDISGEPTSATFTGNNAATDIESAAASGDTSNTKWKFTVPDGVGAGENKLTVVVGDVTLTATVNIAVNQLSVTPTTVVPRQELSIDGDGFTKNAGSDRNNPKNVVPASTDTMSHVTVGGKDASNSEQLVNNNGNISFNIRVPDDVEPGSRKVRVQDAGGRVGEATITVAEPEISLNPAESLVGSQVTVTGTGFPANDLVLIKYGTNTVATSATSSTGSFEQVITIPSGNDPGATVDIEAVAQVQDVPVADKASADAEHTLPDATISLSSTEVVAGGGLTINGASYQGFRQVSMIEVGGQNVTPVPAPTTDEWGAFETTEPIRVPHLTPGRYAVTVRVGDDPGVSATEFIQVVSEAISTAPADVFASIGDRLVRVWYLDRESQTWTFYDPDAELFANVPDDRKLTSVSSGQVVTVITSDGDAVEFQGMTLYAGSNPIALR